MSQEEGQVRSSREETTGLIIIEEEQLSGTLGWKVRRSEVSTRILPSWIPLRCHGPLQGIDGVGAKGQGVPGDLLNPKLVG